jgi:hypothetical protein
MCLVKMNREMSLVLMVLEKNQRDGSDNAQTEMVTNLPPLGLHSSSQDIVPIPVNKSILKSFESHIAFAIWSKEHVSLIHNQSVI